MNDGLRGHTAAGVTRAAREDWVGTESADDVALSPDGRTSSRGRGVVRLWDDEALEVGVDHQTEALRVPVVLEPDRVVLGQSDPLWS